METRLGLELAAPSGTSVGRAGVGVMQRERWVGGGREMEGPSAGAVNATGRRSQAVWDFMKLPLKA